MSIQPRKEAKTQWENPPLNMDRKQNFGNLVINYSSPHDQQSPVVIWDYWMYSHKILCWRYLLLVLKMRSRVEQWYHHAQAPWYSAYGSQCAGLFFFEMDQWRFEWCFDYHNRWLLKTLIRNHILQVFPATINIE